MLGKDAEVARRERRLYLRSPMVWLALLAVVAAGGMVFHYSDPTPLDLALMQGTYLVVPLTVLIAGLVFTAGFAREELERFDDVWHTLPVRSAVQYWGKVLGTAAVSAGFVAAFVVLVPAVWYRGGGTLDAPARTAVLLHVAQGGAAALLAVGLAAFMRSAVPSLAVRAVAYVTLVAALVFTPRLGIPWGTLLAPYVAGAVPMGFSALWGAFPWERAIAWDLAFQASAATALLAAASLLYERRRDPHGAAGLRLALLILSAGFTALAAVHHNAFWHRVQAQARTEPAGVVNAGDDLAPPAVSRYDIAVTWPGGSRLSVSAAVHARLPEGQSTLAFTLHRQWQVASVDGAGVASWRREGDALWVTVADGFDEVRLTVAYEGAPFVWDRSGYMPVPAHFMSARGGYLSAHLAWYPLPGIRDAAASGEQAPGEVRYGDVPLLPHPVSFRLTWTGPADVDVVTSLPASARTAGDAVRVFEGVSDGVSVFAARLVEAGAGGMAVAGARSVIRGADPLLEVYGRLLAFYGDLLGRSLEPTPIVVVPAWLEVAHGQRHSRHRAAPVEEGAALVLPMLGGEHIVLTEHDGVRAVARARTWAQTGDPADLMAASDRLHDALQQRLWSGTHPHMPYTRSAVVEGIANFGRLQWARHVLGEEAYAQALAEVMVRMQEPRPGHQRLADQVLLDLLRLEETAGPSAVQEVLGRAYDHIRQRELDYETFVAFLAG